MAILALATSGPAPEVGLRLGDGTIAREAVEPGRGRGRDVAPRIAGLLAAQGLTPQSLGAVAVDVGPGSFTGVRVGVTTAKTLAYALDLPVVAVDSLAVLAAAAETAAPVLCVRDAGRGTFYYASHGARVEAPDGTSTRVLVAGPVRGTLETLRAARVGAVLVGEGIEALAAHLDLAGPAEDATADVGTLLGLAARHLARGATEPAHDLAPLYLQASAPERLRAGESP